MLTQKVHVEITKNSARAWRVVDVGLIKPKETLMIEYGVMFSLIENFVKKMACWIQTWLA